jgi:DNA polymerase
LLSSLAALRQAEAECRRCELYLHATQVVPGEGVARTGLMLIGVAAGRS